MTDKKEKSNVVPLIRDKTTRTIVKDQFDNPPGKKVKDTIDRINNTMDELKRMVEYQKTLDEKGQPLPPTEETSTLPRQEELEREYRRKQDEAKKKRTSHNQSVTREYRLTSKRTDPSWDK